MASEKAFAYRPEPMRSYPRAVLSLLSLLVCACSTVTESTATAPVAATTASVSPSPTPTGSPSSVDAARADLDQMLADMERIHPDLYHGMNRTDFVAAHQVLKEALPELTENQAMVELMRLVAMVSRGGRDGHTRVEPADPALVPFVPVRIYRFHDGWFVTDAMEPHEALIGQRLVAIEATPIDQVAATAEPLVPRDGPQTIDAFLSHYLLNALVLDGLGLADGTDAVDLTILTPDGITQQTVTLATVPLEEYAAWAAPNGPLGLPAREGSRWLSRPGDPLWLQHLPEIATAYVRFASVAGDPASVANDLLALASDPGLDRVIVDLRQNAGGHESTYYAPLLEAIQDPSIDRPERLFVIVDKLTFSTAALFATEVEQSTGAIFVGEPMGGAPNFFGDTDTVALPDYPIPMDVEVSTRYWQMSTPDDGRVTIEPHITTLMTSTDYFTDFDPAMETIIGSPF
jgi:hypothetical protein